MARLDHTLFVCTHERPDGDPRGSCKARGAEELLTTLKLAVFDHELKGKVRVMKSGCQDQCKRGCSVAVFSAGEPAAETWYTHVTPDDAKELFESHVVAGKRLERLTDDRD